MKITSIRLAMGLIASVLFVSGAAQAQSDKPVPYQEGLHYFVIEDASAVGGDKIEVVELFSYLCTHCYTFDPYIDRWKSRLPENVEFRRIPVVFGRGSWELYARGYITAEMLGLPETAHSAMMDKLWKEKDILRNLDDLAEFYSQFGVEKGKFLSTAKSFAVDGRLRKDQLLVQTYGIRGTPSLVLNGKYRIAGNAAVPSFDAILDVTDFLIERESQAMNHGATATAAVETPAGPEGR
jgi:thiol:disulfide interchange protein DsbA